MLSWGWFSLALSCHTYVVDSVSSRVVVGGQQPPRGGGCRGYSPLYYTLQWLIHCILLLLLNFYCALFIFYNNWIVESEKNPSLPKLLQLVMWRYSEILLQESMWWRFADHLLYRPQHHLIDDKVNLFQRLVSFCVFLCLGKNCHDELHYYCTSVCSRF